MTLILYVCLLVLQAGEVISFEVMSSDQSLVCHYMVISNGKVLSVVDTQLVNNATIDVELSPLHAPLTTLLLYAKMSGGELLSDSVTFNVDGILGNQVRPQQISAVNQ